MNTTAELITNLATLPTDRLLIILALAAIGLAAFTVHAVVSLAKEKKEERR